MTIQVCRFDAPRRDDFYRPHCDGNEAGWCFCVAWRGEAFAKRGPGLEAGDLWNWPE